MEKTETFKMSPEEILDTIENLQQYLKPCKHCRHGIRSEKPYIAMTNVPIPDSVDLKKFKEGTAAYQKALATTACRTCIAIQALRNLPRDKQLAFAKEPNSELLAEGLGRNEECLN
ncbi:MAG: hypothetical protein ABSF44_02420 [Candidatus Bathyarchaeia archaeon]|jgi:hypothetical protein